MKYQVILGQDNRIAVSSADSNLGPDAMEFEFPEDFDFSLQHNYLVIGGELAHDPLPELEPESSPIERLEARVQELAQENQALAQENTATMVALTEVYELLMGVM